MYSRMAEQGTPTEDIELDQQLIFYNDLFGWARVAFQALADRSPPDILYGPSQEGEFVQAPALVSLVFHLGSLDVRLLTLNGYVRKITNRRELPRRIIIIIKNSARNKKKRLNLVILRRGYLF